MKVLVDTNVLIDYICSRSTFCDSAESLFALGMIGKVELYVTDISVINTLYVGRKYGFSQQDLSFQLQRILSFIHISLINDEVINNALDSAWNDKEDAVQYFSALASFAEVIITRNVKDYALSSIPAVAPTDFLDRYL